MWVIAHFDRGCNTCFTQRKIYLENWMFVLTWWFQQNHNYFITDVSDDESCPLMFEVLYCTNKTLRYNHLFQPILLRSLCNRSVVEESQSRAVGPISELSLVLHTWFSTRPLQNLMTYEDVIHLFESAELDLWNL